MIQIKNNKFLLYLLPVLIASCGAPVVKKDFLYIPATRAVSGTGSGENITFDESSNTFEKVADLSTVAFYKGENDTCLKKNESNSISIYSVKRQELTKLKANSVDLLLMKTAFTPGYDFTCYTMLANTEYATPNDYIKNINVDIDQVKDNMYNMDFAIIAINVGNSYITDLKIIDVLPEGVTYVSSRYASKDDFIPLNATLSVVNDIKHKVIKDNNKTTLAFDVISNTGIAPSEMVEILVNVNIQIPETKKF